MTHPFERLTSKQSFRYFVFLLGATIVLAVALGVIGAPLGLVKTLKGGKCDIVSFEFAGTVAHAEAIIDAWNAYGIAGRAKWNTWLDFLFLFCYPNLVVLGILGLLSPAVSDDWRMVGRFTAWVQWLVLACDAAENVALLRNLHGTVVAPWPQVAYACAVVKFGFLLEGVVFLSATVMLRLYLRFRRQ